MTRFLLIMLVGVLSSCNVIAPIAAVIEPEDTTARAYRLPNRPCVIFVEDRVGAIGMNLPGVRSRIGKQATAYLLGNEIHSRMIEPDDALACGKLLIVPARCCRFRKSLAAVERT